MSTTQGSRFREAREQRKHPLGRWIKPAAIESVQRASASGADFVVLDLGTGARDVESLSAITTFARASGMTPMISIPATDAALIQRLLGLGAEGVVFPHIKSPEDARQAVRALRGPAGGTVGAGNAGLGQQDAPDRKEHPRRGQEPLACIVQIQSAEAALAAGDIASVDGVDAVLLDTAVLAAAEGSEDTNPAFIGLVAAAVAAIKMAGVPVGDSCRGEEAFVQPTVDMGYDFTVFGNDTALAGADAPSFPSAASAVSGGDNSNGTFPIWQPSPERRQEANVEVFRRWLAINRGKKFDDYADLQSWSASDLNDFWGAVWSFFDIAAYSRHESVLVEETMPGARWFPGATLNYVDHIFRHRPADQIAVVEECEPGGAGRRKLSWEELERQVAAVAGTLRRNGVRAGDRVIGYMPNIAETVVSFLAAASLGALWTSCGQDYSAPAALDRLGQIEPKVLIAADGYRYGGKSHDRREAISFLRANIPSLKATIIVPRLGLPSDCLDPVIQWSRASAGHTPLQTVPVPFEHPLWVLFSSGTTGRPKGIVHSHGGVLLEHLKSMSFHLDLSPGDVYFWYTSPSWMMWNFQVAGLLVGATILCYDGSPTYPDAGAIWRLSESNRVTYLGTSPGYLQACEKNGLSPALTYNLTGLRTLGVTGSILPAASNAWVANHVGSDIHVASMTGGTDVVTAFATAVPTVPVRAGEISVIALGAALESRDKDGTPLIGAAGELVLTKPMPSMPIYFWDDPHGERYRHAYFDSNPDVWQHGDSVTISEHGTVAVHGRSDATLNRHGVRLGSSDIYQAVEKLPQILESLVIGVEYADGTYWMPLFVTLSHDTTLSDDLIGAIQDIIRQEASPRHVPDDIIAAPAIPHTRTGKKLEIPIKRMFQGAAIETILDPQSVDDVSVLLWYADLADLRAGRRK